MDRVVDFKDKKDDIFSKFNKMDLERYWLSDEEMQRKTNDMSDDNRYYGTSIKY